MNRLHDFFRYCIEIFSKPGLVLIVLSLSACASSSSSGAQNGRVPSGYYRVQAGDNLYRIGLRHGQSVIALQRLNGLSNPHEIEVGQLIRVRGGTQSKPSRVSKATTAVPTDHRRSSGLSSVKHYPTPVVPSIALQWPVRGAILRAYNGTTQKGIDIGGARGVPIKAAAAGTVLYAGDELRGYGRLILLQHSSSTMTAYAHNDSLLVRKGQRVTAGQSIATMGDSGTEGVKLHFEVRVNGKAVNPTRYLPQ